MIKNKINLLFIMSAVFALVIGVISIGRQADAREGNGQKINQISDDNATDDDNDAISEIENEDDNATSDDRNATNENENEDHDENDNSATSTGREKSEEHRSTVANFVRGLLDIADREEDGIGEEVRVVAREQGDSASTTVQAIEKVEKRGKIRTFLFGSDYENLGTLRSEIVKTRNRISQLSQLVESIQQVADKTELQTQIQTLEQEQTKLENFVNQNENKISLFGWLVKFFSK